MKFTDVLIFTNRNQKFKFLASLSNVGKYGNVSSISNEGWSALKHRLDSRLNISSSHRVDPAKVLIVLDFAVSSDVLEALSKSISWVFNAAKNSNFHVSLGHG